jgi:hypothetical protein
MSHVWRERIGAYRVLVGKSERTNHLEDPGLDGRIILKWIFEKWDGEARTGPIWFRIRTGGGCCECGNEPSYSIKCGIFLECLRTC